MISSAQLVLEALGLPLSFTEAGAGYGCYLECGTPLPEETPHKAREADAVLFGAVTSPPDVPGYKSAILSLRKELSLFANIRPVRSWPIERSVQGVDIIIVRENSEGLYSGRERVMENGEVAISERVITRAASERIARFAYELAAQERRKRVTIVHKANVLRESCGLFRRTALDIARRFPAITTDESLVDTMAMRLIREPQQLDVLLTTNLFGDILSDEACMLTGGLGLAASANIGDRHALFEPVHGSAPAIAGKGIANPFAAILAGAMMLSHLGYAEEAGRVERAVEEALRRGKTTPDLGGTLTTVQATEEISAEVQR